MKIIVIGAAGFIGRHCYNFFFKKNLKVFGADILELQNTTNYFLLDKNNTNFEKIFQSNTFDVCINASGAASVPISLQMPMLDFELNTSNVIKLLEAIRVHSPKCYFINFSSAAIYGNPKSLPISESMLATPMSPYGWHKYYGEQICQEYYSFFGVHSCCLRVFSAYGPGLRKQFFWDLYNKLKVSPDIILYGSGNESRDFIFINDIIKCVELIIENRHELPPVINIASGKETTIKEAASIFHRLLDIKGSITFGGEVRTGDPVNWRADISVLQNLGYKPVFSLESGLKIYLEWIKNVL